MMMRLLRWLRMLQLVPAYRAYTVDSLNKLSFLDDLPVTVDERLVYYGVSKDNCKSLVITVSFQLATSK